jgi:hypothetical protein
MTRLLLTSAARSFFILAIIQSGFAAEPPAARMLPGKVEFTIADKPFATYVYQDEKIFRPYFANVHALSGVQVTRNHPPIVGKDATDHDTMHPGIWLAFGDINGEDFWRNKGRVVHDGFIQEPTTSGAELTFGVRNNYVSPAGSLICTEQAQYTISTTAEGILLLIETEIRSPKTLKFGDQEEMGLGVRVATPINVRQGGRILNNKGQVNEAEVWGQDAVWCDYSGTIGDQPAGALLMQLYNSGQGANWFHARDYGLMVANTFRLPKFTGRFRVLETVEPSESLELVFGVLIHEGLDAKDAEKLYQRMASSERRIQ